MMALAWIMGAFALIVLTSIVTVVLIVRALYKRIRRSRTLNGAVLRTRATLSWGAQHDVLQLRIRLNDTLDSGQAAIDLAARGDGPRGELPRLFRRIQAEASTLDAELRFLESEDRPGRARGMAARASEPRRPGRRDRAPPALGRRHPVSAASATKVLAVAPRGCRP